MKKAAIRTRIKANNIERERFMVILLRDRLTRCFSYSQKIVMSLKIASIQTIGLLGLRIPCRRDFVLMIAH
jgi:hypothetical protein